MKLAWGKYFCINVTVSILFYVYFERIYFDGLEFLENDFQRDASAGVNTYFLETTSVR